MGYISYKNNMMFMYLFLDCPADLIYNSTFGSCYYFISDADRGYSDNQDICQSALPGYSKLVLIDSLEEDDFLKQHGAGIG